MTDGKPRKKFAIKLFDLALYDRKEVEHESNLLKDFKHRNIVERQESFEAKVEQRRYYVLVLEFCEEGTL